MADDRYTRTDRNGTPNKAGHFDKYTLYNVKRAEAKLGYSLTVLQGGYNAGGVAASAGTHDGAGALDLAPYDWANKVKAMRSVGFAAWHRPHNWDGRGGIEHIHCILIGNTHASAGAKAQVTAYRRFRNGLANNAADLTAHPATYLVKSAPYKVTTLRIGQFNFPGPDKIDDPAGRIKSMLRLVKPQSLHVIGWNELVGIKKAHIASDFAHDVDAALGSKWLLVKPTLALNENYISYRGDVLKLIKQHDDVVLPSSSGGRHLTIAEFRYKNGFEFMIGQTQLVETPGGSSAAETTTREKARQAQAVVAYKTLDKISDDRDGLPYIFQGDVNTHIDLAAFAKAGLKRTRKYADISTTRNDATYTNIAKTAPSVNTDWIIDQQWTFGFYVVAYNVIRDMTKGLFRKPRASDHDLVVTTLTA